MQEQHFKISIIIPCINEEKNLEALLPYLVNYGYDKVDIIVIDGGSEDSTIDVAKANGVRYEVAKKCQRSIQLNLGASLALEKILFFVHADVIPPKTYLKDILYCVKNGKKAGWFSYHFDESKGLMKCNEWFTQFKGLFAGGGDQCIFTLKTTFEEVGRFDESLVVMEDFNFTRKLRGNRISTCVIKKNCIVSSRKYKTNSWLRVNFANLLAFSMYHLTFDSKTIKKVYQKILNSY